MNALTRLGASIIRAYLSLRYQVEAQPITLLSEQEKREHLLFWGRVSGCKIFVETGTYLGRTTLQMSEVFERCYTVEYDVNLYERAKVVFADKPNITALHGDSGELIGTILSALDEPAIFWLDAHYSGRNTRPEKDTPIFRELKAIFSHKIKSHVILVDDARFFRGTNDYPQLKKVQKLVADMTDYSIRVHNDIIRIYRDDI